MLPAPITAARSFTQASLRQPVRKYRERRRRERALEQAVVAARPDIIHCNDTNTLAIGARAARQLGVPYVYEAHELYPDSLMQRPFQRTWPVQSHLRSVERGLVPHAAAVITVSDGLARVLKERYGVTAHVIASVPELRPIGDRQLLKRQLGLA
jgi:glycosyltransferase involved in cell wall biosynthesis